MLKKYSMILLLAIVSLHAQESNDQTIQSDEIVQESVDQDGEMRSCCNKCQEFSNLIVSNSLRTKTLAVTTNETIGSNLTVNGSEYIGGSLNVVGCVNAACYLLSGQTFYSGIRSYGYAYNTLGQSITTGGAATAVTFNTPSSTLNNGVTVAGTAITIANAGIYLVNYSVLFDVVTGTIATNPLTATAQLYNLTTTTTIANTVSNAVFVVGDIVGRRLEVTGSALLQTAAANTVLNLNVSSASTTGGNTVAIPSVSGQAAASVQVFQLN